MVTWHHTPKIQSPTTCKMYPAQTSRPACRRALHVVAKAGCRHAHAHAHASFISTTTKPLPDSATNTDYDTLTMTAFTTTPIRRKGSPYTSKSDTTVTLIQESIIQYQVSECPLCCTVRVKGTWEGHDYSHSDGDVGRS